VSAACKQFQCLLRTAARHTLTHAHVSPADWNSSDQVQVQSVLGQHLVNVAPFHFNSQQPACCLFNSALAEGLTGTPWHAADSQFLRCGEHVWSSQVSVSLATETRRTRCIVTAAQAVRKGIEHGSRSSPYEGAVRHARAQRPTPFTML
jgi:hypothetical protein